ncbi:hypothetical protein D8S78_05030 [Natrialba swarupiae]|nr:hypothetical protein [Natrialba swarupiae]
MIAGRSLVDPRSAGNDSSQFVSVLVSVRASRCRAHVGRRDLDRSRVWVYRQGTIRVTFGAVELLRKYVYDRLVCHL